MRAKWRVQQWSIKERLRYRGNHQPTWHVIYKSNVEHQAYDAYCSARTPVRLERRRFFFWYRKVLIS